MVDEGYAATQILSQLHESIIEQDLNDKQKSAITEKMAVSDSKGAPGIPEEHWAFFFSLTHFKKRRNMISVTSFILCFI